MTFKCLCNKTITFSFIFISSHFWSFVYHRITNVIKFIYKIMNETRKPSYRWQTWATRKKVNGDHTPVERRWGAHLPHIGLWARRWIDHWVCDAWPVRRKTNGYLPSRRTSPPLGRYQIVLLGNRGTWVCEQLARSCYLAIHRPRVEPATSRSTSSPLQHPATTPLSHTQRESIPTRSQAVARIADRTAKNCRGHVT